MENSLNGKVVRALAGKDKGALFLVVGQTDDGRLLLANGKSRRVERPKKKKIKHVQMIGHEGFAPLGGRDGMLTNRAVRSMIREVRSFLENEKE